MLGALWRAFNDVPTINERYNIPDLNEALAIGQEKLRQSEARQDQTVAAAKEMLSSSHRAIFQAQGQRLGQVDIFDDASLSEAQYSQYQAGKAWQLAMDCASSTYGNLAVSRALFELGLR